MMPDDPKLRRRVLRQQVADMRPGWTLGYIDELFESGEIEDVLSYLDGKAKAMEELNRANG